MSIICAIHEGSWIIAAIIFMLLVAIFFITLTFYWALSDIQKFNVDSVLEYSFYTFLGFVGIWLISKIFIPGYGCK